MSRSNPLTELEMWHPDVTVIADGDVVTEDGRPVNFRGLLKRRWGWPKKAAYMAADHLLEQARLRGTVAVLRVADRDREMQQDYLMKQIPGLDSALRTGLARGASREINDASHEITGIEIRLREPICDDGLTTAVLDAIGRRFGVSAAAAREHVHFDTETSEILMEVNVARLDP